MTPRDVLRLMGVGAFAGTAGRLYFGQPSSFMPDVELALRAGPGEARILPGPSSRVWRFTGELMKGPPHSLEVSMGMPQTSLPNGSVLSLLTVRVDRRDGSPFHLPERLSILDRHGRLRRPWRPGE